MKRFLPLLILAVLQAADYVSTRLAFAHGAHEANALTSSLGVAPTKLLALAIVGVILWRKPRSRWLPWLACGVYVLIVANNLALAAIP